MHLVDIDAENLDKTKSQILSLSSVKVITHVKNLAVDCIDIPPETTLLINSAGLTMNLGLEETTPSKIANLIMVN
jgi:hypothetical protein